jgi:hypothetical protein
VWLGALVPVDGIWRSTGNGIRLSPVEGDAVAEYADEVALLGIEMISGVPRDELPDPGSMSIRFGQAEPYCVRWEADETPGAEFAEFASAVTAGLITRLASQVWWKRAKPLRLENTDGDPMLLIDATITIRGDVTRRLLAHPDFAEEGEDDQIVWWGERVEPLDPDDEAERWVLGRVTPGEGRIRVRVNSQRRLRRLMRILTAMGVEPQVTAEKQTEPSLDFAWGPRCRTAVTTAPAMARMRGGGRRTGWTRRWPRWTSALRGKPPGATRWTRSRWKPCCASSSTRPGWPRRAASAASTLPGCGPSSVAPADRVGRAEVRTPPPRT